MEFYYTCLQNFFQLHSSPLLIALPRQSHRHFCIMCLYTDLYTAYDLTARLRIHIKVKHYDPTPEVISAILENCYRTYKLIKKAMYNTSLHRTAILPPGICFVKILNALVKHRKNRFLETSPTTCSYSDLIMCTLI